MAIALPQAIDDAPDRPHHSTSGIQANVVRLFEMSSIDSVGPQSISVIAPMNAARAEANREKSKKLPQPRSTRCSRRKITYACANGTMRKIQNGG